MDIKGFIQIKKDIFLKRDKILIKNRTDPVISFPQRKVNTAVGEVVHPRCSFMAEWWLSVKLEGTSRSQGLFSLSRAQRALFPASASCLCWRLARSGGGEFADGTGFSL